MTESQIDIMVGKNIMELRKSRRINQGDLSRYLGFKRPSSLSKIEQGNQKVSPYVVYRLMEYFSVPMSRILPLDSLRKDQEISERPGVRSFLEKANKILS